MGRYQFDLPAYVAQRLRQAGVESVEDLAHDTYADQRHLHSFRRATHQGVQTAGRQISAIACG
jgi:copper oxidase (laccase) domain-containing protein